MCLSIAPARVCLYGEHQDYLGLKVIPAAISMTLKIIAEKNANQRIQVMSTTNNEHGVLPTNISKLSKNTLSLQTYIEAATIAFKDFFSLDEVVSIEAKIISSIPIASGLSSSAALLVAWINLLSHLHERELSREALAELAYHAEHNILGVPCGRMDQYSSAFGNVIILSCSEPPDVEEVSFPSSKIIVVNSQTKKLTSDVHGNVAIRAKELVKKFEEQTHIHITEANSKDLEKIKRSIKKGDYRLLSAILKIKEYTEEAELELKKPAPDLEKLGELLILQHRELRDGFKVSTKLLDKIVEAGINTGVLGGKLTGAGLGGCVVFLAHEDEALKIAKSLSLELKLPVWVATITKGARIVS